MKTKSRVNDVQVLMAAAKRAGERTILKHRLAGISVTGSYRDSSLIVTHKIEYSALSNKAKYRESMKLPAVINEKHNQKVLSDSIGSAHRESLLENGMIAYSISKGYRLTHKITAKTLCSW